MSQMDGVPCHLQYEQLFHPLMSFSGHPLRHSFLGDPKGCEDRGFAYFMASAKYTFTPGGQHGWLPDVFFGLCAPYTCGVDDVEVSLAPLYLSLLLQHEGATGIQNLQVSAVRFRNGFPGFDASPRFVPFLLLAAPALLATLWCLAFPPRDGTFWNGILTSLDMRSNCTALFCKSGRSTRCGTVAFLRLLATISVIAYHAFFFEAAAAFRCALQPFGSTCLGACRAVDDDNFQRA